MVSRTRSVAATSGADRLCPAQVLGGLLSAHLFAVDETLGLMEPHGDLERGGYGGELLKLAVDLGWRLLPAFDTATGIPYVTVNLA